MKKRLQLLLSFLFFIASASIAQVPNASFENWTNSLPDSWTTNSSPTFPTITQSTDAHTGFSALKGEVVNNVGFGVPPNVYPSSTNGYGFPISHKYVTLIGWYKADLLGTDKITVNVVVYKSSGLSIGFGFSNLPSVSSYTPFSIPISYTSMGNPGFLSVTFAMSDTTGLGFHIGSYFIIDDLGLELVSGINTVNTTAFNIFPDPASNQVNIIGDFKANKPYDLKLINSLGAIEMNTTVLSSSESLPPLDVSLLPEGVYLLKISDSNNSTSQRVIIRR